MDYTAEGAEVDEVWFGLSFGSVAPQNSFPDRQVYHASLEQF
jgi:hypothetical protein